MSYLVCLVVVTSFHLRFSFSYKVSFLKSRDWNSLTLLLSDREFKAWPHFHFSIPTNPLGVEYYKYKGLKENELTLFLRASLYIFTFILNVQIHITLLKFRVLVEMLQAFPWHWREANKNNIHWQRMSSFVRIQGQDTRNICRQYSKSFTH